MIRAAYANHLAGAASRALSLKGMDIFAWLTNGKYDEQERRASFCVSNAFLLLTSIGITLLLGSELCALASGAGAAWSIVAYAVLPVILIAWLIRPVKVPKRKNIAPAYWGSLLISFLSAVLPRLDRPPAR